MQGTHFSRKKKDVSLFFILDLCGGTDVGIMVELVQPLRKESIMVPSPPRLLRLFFGAALGLILITAGHAVLALELHAIGKVESLYRDRASMRIIELVGTPSADVTLGEGNWVNFDIPQVKTKNRRRQSIRYGDIVEVHLHGHSATEYATDESGSTESPPKPGAMIWSTKSVERVKNPRHYETGDKDAGTKKDRKSRRGKNKKAQEPPPKIWTQEETVRGVVLVRGDHLYLKEDRLGKKDKGLHVTTSAWVEKLKPYDGQRVVVHGTTHRVTVSSGTMELENLMKIYPK
jgi:hypothetical protein